jgi:hypothetical protein
MNVKRVLASVVVFAAGSLICAGSASAQWSGSIVVTNAVEPSSGGQNVGGVTAARCGSNVVVGFGDFESGNNQSFAGYATSSNGGATFRDLGVLPISPADSGRGQDQLGDGAPQRPTVDHDLSLACANSSLFYYAAPLLEANDPQICTSEGICSSISVSISRNGGHTWDLPITIARENIDNHQLSFPSIGVDPATPKRLYVAYLDENGAPWDFSFPDCQGNTITELRLASSADGGKTWTSNAVDHVCDLSSNPETQGALGGPSLVVSPGGKVYLTYEFQSFGSDAIPAGPNQIRFMRSVDQGQTFSPSLIVSKTAIDNALPHVAVDRTNTTSRGRIYLTWAGSQSGTYTDILISDSTSFGTSFSFPRPLNPPPAAGSGRFQTESVLSVDNDGQVAACYYETPTNSPTTSSVYSYNCKLSFNHAATWQPQHVLSSVPVGFAALTSDFLLGGDGFFTAFELDPAGARWVVGRKADAN